MKIDWINIGDRTNFVKPIKTFHPSDPRYIPYWREEKKRIIEGHWVYDKGGWRYMPAKLYFTVNHGTIMLTDEMNKTRFSGRPDLNALFWEFGYMSLESLGFSGFKDDEYYTCNKDILTLDKNYTNVNSKKHINLFKSNGQFKEYVSPREYMRVLHTNPLDRAIYENEPKNTTILGSRSGGKSFITANAELAHELITGGIKEYSEQFIKNPPKVTVLVGSGDAAKSSDLCSKVRDVFIALSEDESLGVYGKIGDDDYTPSPFYLDMVGDIGPNNKENPLRHEYKVRINGREVVRGTGSSLHHVVYSEQKAGKKGGQAGAGGRYQVSVIEEQGLCFGKGTLIRLFDGTTKKIEDVTKDDIIMGDDGSKRHIKQLAKGVDDLFLIEQNNGKNYIVNSNHPLVVYDKYDFKRKHVGKTLVKAKDFYNYTNAHKKETYGIKSDVLNFDKSHLSLDPYYLGCWLGDGNSADQNISFNLQKDVESLQYLSKYAKTIGLTWKLRTKKTISLGCLINKKGKKNYIKEELKKLNLLNNKHIPINYLLTNTDDRLNLLAGIIDTDGYLGFKGKTTQVFEIAVSKNKNLKEQIEFLARGLGFKVSTTTTISNKGYNNKIIENREKYRIRISGDIHKIPTKLNYKQAEKIQHKKNHLCCGLKITKLGKGEYFGFELFNNPYFLLEDNTVVHNTPLLRDAFRSNEATIQTDGFVFGRQLLLGTSENIEAVIPAKEIFTNPLDYRMLSYDDDYEHSGKIGFFLPATLTLREAHDENGNVNLEKALDIIKKRREEKAKSSNPDILRGEKLNYPIYPSEMWLGTKAKLLPYEEAALREKELMANNLYHKIGKAVRLTWDSNSTNGVKYEIDYEAKPIFTYPVTNQTDVEGAMILYDFPQFINGTIPSDMYIYTHDPYIADGYDEGGSLGSTKIWLNPKYWGEYMIGSPLVAAYLGKAKNGKKQYYENQEKLIQLYGNCNQMLYYEANRGEDCYYHYLAKGKLNLLAPRPSNSDSMFQETVRKFGFVTPSRIEKLNMISSFSDLLLSKIKLDKHSDIEKTFISTIPDIYLIREIMAYNLDDNFDAISCALGYPIAIREIEKNTKNELVTKSSGRNPLSFLVSNPKMFRTDDYENNRQYLKQNPEWYEQSRKHS